MAHRFLDISKGNDPQLQKELENILMTSITRDSGYDSCSYEDLLRDQFKLTNVYRVERKNDADDNAGKIADFTQETIWQLIKKGEDDALKIFS